MADQVKRVGLAIQENDAREALRDAIRSRHNDLVVGIRWLTLSPAADPPNGFSCDAGAWLATLDLASSIMTTKGYAMSEILRLVAATVLAKPLNNSIQIIDGHVVTSRAYAGKASSLGALV
jgi:hypothetical protein